MPSATTWADSPQNAMSCGVEARRNTGVPTISATGKPTSRCAAKRPRPCLFGTGADRTLEKVTDTLPRREVVQRIARQLRRLEAAPDTQLGHSFQVQDGSLILGHPGVMDDDLGPQRTRRVDRGNNRIAVVHQLD